MSLGHISAFLLLVAGHGSHRGPQDPVPVPRRREAHHRPAQDNRQGEVLEQLQSITAEEKIVLKELVKKHSEYKNEDEFLAALKEKSPSLHEKALKLHNLVNEKVDKLGDEAKSFVVFERVLTEARKIQYQYLAGEKPTIDQLKTIAKAHLAAFNDLSDGAKDEFKTQFPILTSVFTNPKIKALAEQN